MSKYYKEWAKNYYQKNIQERRERARNYYYKNRERINSEKRRKRKEDPIFREKQREYDNKYRHSQSYRNPNYKYQSPKFSLLAERGFKCEKCGIQNQNSSFFDLDHITPRRKLGIGNKEHPTKKDKKNLMILCPNCHRVKTINEGWKE